MRPEYSLFFLPNPLFPLIFPFSPIFPPLLVNFNIQGIFIIISSKNAVFMSKIKYKKYINVFCAGIFITILIVLYYSGAVNHFIKINNNMISNNTYYDIIEISCFSNIIMNNDLSKDPSKIEKTINGYFIFLVIILKISVILIIKRKCDRKIRLE